MLNWRHLQGLLKLYSLHLLYAFYLTKSLAMDLVFISHVYRYIVEVNMLYFITSKRAIMLKPQPLSCLYWERDGSALISVFVLSLLSSPTDFLGNCPDLPHPPPHPTPPHPTPPPIPSNNHLVTVMLTGFFYYEGLLLCCQFVRCADLCGFHRFFTHFITLSPPFPLPLPPVIRSGNPSPPHLATLSNQGITKRCRLSWLTSDQ